MMTPQRQRGERDVNCNPGDQHHGRSVYFAAAHGKRPVHFNVRPPQRYTYANQCQESLQIALFGYGGRCGDANSGEGQDIPAGFPRHSAHYGYQGDTTHVNRHTDLRKLDCSYPRLLRHGV